MQSSSSFTQPASHRTDTIETDPSEIEAFEIENVESLKIDCLYAYGQVLQQIGQALLAHHENTGRPYLEDAVLRYGEAFKLMEQFEFGGLQTKNILKGLAQSNILLNRPMKALAFGFRWALFSSTRINWLLNLLAGCCGALAMGCLISAFSYANSELQSLIPKPFHFACAPLFWIIQVHLLIIFPFAVWLVTSYLNLPRWNANFGRYVACSLAAAVFSFLLGYKIGFDSLLMSGSICVHHMSKDKPTPVPKWATKLEAPILPKAVAEQIELRKGLFSKPLPSDYLQFIDFEHPSTSYAKHVLKSEKYVEPFFTSSKSEALIQAKITVYNNFFSSLAPIFEVWESATEKKRFKLALQTFEAEKDRCISEYAVALHKIADDISGVPQARRAKISAYDIFANWFADGRYATLPAIEQKNLISPVIDAANYFWEQKNFLKAKELYEVANHLNDVQEQTPQQREFKSILYADMAATDFSLNDATQAEKDYKTAFKIADTLPAQLRSYTYDQIRWDCFSFYSTEGDFLEAARLYLQAYPFDLSWSIVKRLKKD